MLLRTLAEMEDPFEEPYHGDTAEQLRNYKQQREQAMADWNMMYNKLMKQVPALAHKKPGVTTMPVPGPNVILTTDPSSDFVEIEPDLYLHKVLAPDLGKDPELMRFIKLYKYCLNRVDTVNELDRVIKRIKEQETKAHQQRVNASIRRYGTSRRK